MHHSKKDLVISPLAERQGHLNAKYDPWNDLSGMAADGVAAVDIKKGIQWFQLATSIGHTDAQQALTLAKIQVCSPDIFTCIGT